MRIDRVQRVNIFVNMCNSNWCTLHMASYIDEHTRVLQHLLLTFASPSKNIHPDIVAPYIHATLSLSPSPHTYPQTHISTHIQPPTTYTHTMYIQAHMHIYTHTHTHTHTHRHTCTHRRTSFLRRSLFLLPSSGLTFLQ